MNDKKKFIKRTDLLINAVDFQNQDSKGNVFLNTKDQYLSLTLDENIRITLNSTFKGTPLLNPDFILKDRAIIIRIKNKIDYPYYNISTSTKETIDYIEIVNLLKQQFNAVETDELNQDFPSASEVFFTTNK